MKDIAIYGAGGFGREVACLIKRINEQQPTWNFIGFFDDNELLRNKPISHFGICLGGINELNNYPNELAVAIAIGNSVVVRSVVNRITNKNISFPNLIHPNFNISDKESFQIGCGNIIQGGCSVTCSVSIGNFNVLNGSVAIGHDCLIGSYNTFMPAVRVSGGVEIGELNFFGVGSIILQQLKITDNIRLAAGSVLMTKPRSGFLYIGVPAKKMEL